MRRDNSAGAVPEKSKMDTFHIAHAAVHGMDFLITWNQKHIVTDRKRKQIEAIIEEFDFNSPGGVSSSSSGKTSRSAI